LPTWVRFIGPISPPAEDLNYNASTREIVWNIRSIPKGTGITEIEKEVSFQIGFTPSLSQLGKMPILINEATLTGHDDFANVDVRVKKGTLNTMLKDDPSFVGNGAKVIE